MHVVDAVIKQSPRALKQTQRTVFETNYELDEPQSLPDDEGFKISAFGVPEPSLNETPPKTRLFLWVALIGGLLAILGLLLRRLQLRRA